MAESMHKALTALHESLSAAVDGEAEALELGRVLSAVGDKVELRAKWERLHLIGGIIRGEVVPCAGVRLHAGARHALVAGAVPMITATTARRAWRVRGRWLGPVTGFAAAAAALVVVLYFGSDRLRQAPPATPEVALTEAAAGPSRGLAQVPSEHDLRRANAYMLQHVHYTSITGSTAAMPFAKVLTTSNGVGEEPQWKPR